MTVKAVLDKNRIKFLGTIRISYIFWLYPINKGLKLNFQIHFKFSERKKFS